MTDPLLKIYEKQEKENNIERQKENIYIKYIIKRLRKKIRLSRDSRLFVIKILNEKLKENRCLKH